MCPHGLVLARRIYLWSWSLQRFPSGCCCCADVPIRHGRESLRVSGRTTGYGRGSGSAPSSWLAGGDLRRGVYLNSSCLTLYSSRGRSLHPLYFEGAGFILQACSRRSTTTGTEADGKIYGSASLASFVLIECLDQIGACDLDCCTLLRIQFCDQLVLQTSLSLAESSARTSLLGTSVHASLLGTSVHALLLGTSVHVFSLSQTLRRTTTVFRDRRSGRCTSVLCRLAHSWCDTAHRLQLRGDRPDLRSIRTVSSRDRGGVELYPYSGALTFTTVF